MHLQTYEYDSGGRLIRIVANGRIAESYEYDAAGRKQKTVHIDVAGQRPGTKYCWGVEGTDSTYSVPGTARLTTVYNERGNPIELLFHDQSGRQLSRIEFHYDEGGRLVEEAQTNDNEEALAAEMRSLTTWRRYRYDAQGLKSREPVEARSASRLHEVLNLQRSWTFDPGSSRVRNKGVCHGR